MSTENTKTDYVLMHINNGGITFKINKNTFDFHGELIHRVPVLEINANHMSTQTNHMVISMTPERLKAMGEWLIQMSEESKEWYVNKNAGKGFDEGLLIGFEKYIYIGDDKNGEPIYENEANVKENDEFSHQSILS